MFYAAFTDGNNELTVGIYKGFSKNYDTTGLNILHLIDFTVNGTTYAEKQESLRSKAIDFQYADSEMSGGLSMGEYADVSNWFESNGRRYGLLTEFRENAIC